MDTKTFNQRFKVLTQREQKINERTIITNTESIVNVVNGHVELSTIRVSIIQQMNHNDIFDKVIPHYVTHKLIEKETHEEYFKTYTPDEHFIEGYLNDRFNLIDDESRSGNKPSRFIDITNNTRRVKIT